MVVVIVVVIIVIIIVIIIIVIIIQHAATTSPYLTVMQVMALVATMRDFLGVHSVLVQSEMMELRCIPLPDGFLVVTTSAVYTRPVVFPTPNLHNTGYQ